MRLDGAVPTKGRSTINLDTTQNRRDWLHSEERGDRGGEMRKNFPCNHYLYLSRELLICHLSLRKVSLDRFRFKLFIIDYKIILNIREKQYQ